MPGLTLKYASCMAENFCFTEGPRSRMLTAGNTPQLREPPVESGLATLKAGASARAGAGLLTTVTETAGATLRWESSTPHSV